MFRFVFTRRGPTHAIINGATAPDAVVTEIVDLVLLPLLRGYSVPST